MLYGKYDLITPFVREEDKTDPTDPRLSELKKFFEKLQAPFPYDVPRIVKKIEGDDKEEALIENAEDKIAILTDIFDKIKKRTRNMLSTAATAKLSIASNKAENNYFNFFVPVTVDRNIIPNYANLSQKDRLKPIKATDVSVEFKPIDNKFYMPLPTKGNIFAVTQLMGKPPRFLNDRFKFANKLSVESMVSAIDTGMDNITTEVPAYEKKEGKWVEVKKTVPEEVAKAYAYARLLLGYIKMYIDKETYGNKKERYIYDKFTSKEAEIKSRILESLIYMYENHKEYYDALAIWLPKASTVKEMIKSKTIDPTVLAASKLLIAKLTTGTLSSAIMYINANYPNENKGKYSHVRGSIRIFDIPVITRLILPEIAYWGVGGYVKAKKRSFIGNYKYARDMNKVYQLYVKKAEPDIILGGEGWKVYNTPYVSLFPPRQAKGIVEFAPVRQVDTFIKPAAGVSGGFYTKSLYNILTVLNQANRILERQITADQAVKEVAKKVTYKTYETTTIGGKEVKFAPLWVSTWYKFDEDNKFITYIHISAIDEDGNIYKRTVTAKFYNKETKSWDDNVYNVIINSTNILNAWMGIKGEWYKLELSLMPDKEGNIVLGFSKSKQNSAEEPVETADTDIPDFDDEDDEFDL